MPEQKIYFIKNQKESLQDNGRQHKRHIQILSGIKLSLIEMRHDTV